MYFLSTLIPAFANSSDRLALLIEPNNLSPAPTFAAMLTDTFFNCSTIAVAAATNLASSSFLASKTSANSCLFFGVANTAYPCGIRKFLA